MNTMNTIDTQRARIQAMETRIKELESTSAVPALEREIAFIEGVVFNPSYNATDMRLLLVNTPRELRMGLTTEFPEKKTYLPAQAKKAYTSEKTASRRLRTLADTGMFSYRYEEDPETKKTHVHLCPLPALENAPIISIERAKEGGSTWENGKRVKRCKDCDSPNLVKVITSQIICGDCGVPQSEPLTSRKQVNPPDAYLNEEEDHRHSDTRPTEEEDSRCHSDTHPLEEQREEPIPHHSHSDTDPTTVTVTPDSAPIELHDNVMKSDDPTTVTVTPMPAHIEIPKLPSLTVSVTPSTYALGEYPLGDFSLRDWLANRRGHGQMIYSTGILDQSKKYLHKPAEYAPDIAAYLRGDLQHIYGSRPARDDGTTYLLGFDSEKPELDAHRLEWMTQLAAAGIPSVCWMRRPGRWHLEVYVDKALDRKAFYAYVTQACPGLLSIPECFPIGRDQNTGGDDRSDFPYSWPLYYRIGAQVIECAAEVMFPGDQSPMVSTGIQSDRARLTWLISQAIMEASLIPELPTPEDLTQDARGMGGLLLDTRSPDRPVSPCDDGLAKAVIADFNAAYTWEQIVDVQAGRFRASWRNERTPSVIINADGTAHDFGKTGRYPNHFDKFEAYCLINGIDKREELKRRIAAYQEREQIAS